MQQAVGPAASNRQRVDPKVVAMSRGYGNLQRTLLAVMRSNGGPWSVADLTVWVYDHPYEDERVKISDAPTVSHLSAVSRALGQLEQEGHVARTDERPQRWRLAGKLAKEEENRRYLKKRKEWQIASEKGRRQRRRLRAQEVRILDPNRKPLGDWIPTWRKAYASGYGEYRNYKFNYRSTGKPTHRDELPNQTRLILISPKGAPHRCKPLRRDEKCRNCNPNAKPIPRRRRKQNSGTDAGKTSQRDAGHQDAGMSSDATPIAAVPSNR